MKVKFKESIGIGLLMSILVFMPVTVLAHEDGTDHEDGPDTVRTTSVEETEKPNPEEVKKRISERKAAIRTRLSAAKEQRLKGRCQASQGKLNSIQGRVKGFETSRMKIYQNLVDRLNKASERLAANDIDVSVLNQQIKELSSLIETFNNNLYAYKVTVGDLSAMDCVEDAAGFQATLEAARQARIDAGNSSQAVRAYLQNTIKPTLVELRQQLTQANDTNNENSEPTNDQVGNEEN